MKYLFLLGFISFSALAAPYINCDLMLTSPAPHGQDIFGGNIKLVSEVSGWQATFVSPYWTDEPVVSSNLIEKDSEVKDCKVDNEGISYLVKKLKIDLCQVSNIKTIVAPSGQDGDIILVWFLGKEVQPTILGAGGAQGGSSSKWPFVCKLK